MNAMRQTLLVAALAALSTPAFAQHAGHAQHAQQTEHAEHTQHDAHAPPSEQLPREPIPPLTDADRAAAFPAGLSGHAVHDDIHSFVLVDRLETSDAGDDPLAWEASAWIGTDLDRAWLRSEGEAADGRVEAANLELFYGRAVSRWWDGVVGVRHDVGDGPSRTYAAIGVIGLAPQKFEVEATAYLGDHGQAGLAVEAEYDTLLTNRLVLQWQAGAEAWGRSDPQRGLGAGLATVEAGLRLRYEVTRRFAPYVGIAHERAFGNTADLRRAGGHPTDDTRVVAGVRFWF